MNLNIVRYFDKFDDSESSSDDDIEIMQYILTLKEKVFRPRPSPRETWGDSDFVSRYRMSKESVKWLDSEIGRYLKRPTTRNYAVTSTEQILLTLRFFATGNIKECLGDLFGLHKSTASRIIHTVSKVICQKLKHFISIPRQTEEMEKTVKKFYEVAKFPNVFGAVDCMHVPILNPGGNNSELYRNRKNTFSYKVQVVADADLKILDIVARWPGSEHDSTIFNASVLKQRLDAGEFGSHCLLGHGGYASTKYLLTPLQNPVSEPEKLYNESQIQTRYIIERTLSVWKKRFPCLGTLLRVKLENIQAIIVGTAILHNYCVQNMEDLPANQIGDTISTTSLTNMDDPTYNGPEDDTYRNYLINYYFSRLQNSREAYF